MPKRGDKELVMDMLIACEKILKYTKNLSYDEFCKNDLVVDAVVRNIEIPGEASRNVSDAMKSKYTNVERREIVRTRNKIIHFYFGVNYRYTYDTFGG